MSESTDRPRLRGRYKRYLTDESVAIPRQTLQSIKKRRENEPINQSKATEETSTLGNYDRDVFGNEGDVVLSDDSEKEDADSDHDSDGDESCSNLCNDDRQYHFDGSDENVLNASDSETPLYESCRITRKEADLLILSYSLRHNVNDTALEDLLFLINAFLPENCLPSKHLFLKKYSAAATTQVLKKYYCNVCFVVLLDSLECSSCSKNYKKTNLDAEYQYYLYIPLKNQLVDFLNSPVYRSVRNYREEVHYNDVINSEFYRTNMNNMSQNDLTLQVNTDGVNPLESSVLSLWPIQAMINELPFNLRRQHMFLVSLWYNKEKPHMNLYLQSFVEEMQDLSSNGITILDPFNGEEINIKVYVLLFTVDSVARPMLQNIHQFNGTCGCTFCLQPGEQWHVGDGQTRVYRGTKITPLRNLEQHNADTVLAYQRKDVINGIKGPSILSCLPSPFDITKCFSTDYLHNHLLGVTKLFLDSWFDSSNHGNDWYLGTKVETFDKILLQIRPPVEITRTPRSVVYRKQWKGSEYKNFLLYYSIHCLQDLIPKRYIDHWSLFVKSTYIFLKPSFTEEEFISAQSKLKQFVEQIEKLYDASFYKFNVHLLLHVSDCIRMFGALWATSGFPFEHYNGLLSKMFFGSTQVPKQIVKRYLRYKNVNWQPMLTETCPEYAKQLFQKMSKRKNFGIFQMTRISSGMEEIELLGRCNIIKISTILKNCIEREINVSDIVEVESFPRCCIRGMLLYCCRLLPKRCNSVIQLDSGGFAVVGKIFRIIDGRILLEVELLVNDALSNSSIPSHVSDLYFAVRKSGVIAVIQPCNVKKKAILMQSSNMEIFGVATLVNHFERD